MHAIPKQAEGIGRVNYLTEEDQGRVIQWLTDHEFEDVAFATRVLLFTGFRISEFLGLAKDNFRGDWVHLHEGSTKNNEKRTVYVGDIAVELSARVASGLPSPIRSNRGRLVPGQLCSVYRAKNHAAFSPPFMRNDADDERRELSDSRENPGAQKPLDHAQVFSH